MKYKITWIILVILTAISFSMLDNTTVNASSNITNSTINSSLHIYDNGPVYVNESFIIMANYSHENGSIIGLDVCRYDNSFMDFNMSTGLYYYQTFFENPGNFTYTINCQKQGYENLSQNAAVEVLDINSTIDSDNDGYSNTTDCDDNNPNINPGHSEILYNSQDDDCNPATLDYLIFDITTDKQSYSPQETVNILINATNQSDTYITINTPTNVSYVYIFSSGSYPVTQQFSLTGLSGPYNIEGLNYYHDYTNQDNVDFTVDSTFNVVIEVSKTTAYTNENLHFKAVITGSIGATNLIWNMDNGNEVYNTEFDYKYDYARQYNVVLIATDQGGNQITKTVKIIINPNYYLKVKVIDNKTSDIIKNATVRLDSKKRQVNSSGMTEFNITNTTYELRVTADDYYTYNEDIKINKSLVFTVKLSQRTEDIPPIISVISPANKSVITDQNFKFKFLDNGNSDCILFISEGDGWWLDYQEKTNLKPNTDHTFATELDPGLYFWKIECIDEQENIGYSKDYFVNITVEQQFLEVGPETNYVVVENVYNVIPDFETYSPDEKKIVEFLKMDVLIKDAKRKLEMANRDLFNIRYEPNTESVLKKRDEIYARIDQIKDETPLSISVKDKVEFVKYVDDNDVETAFTKYAEIKDIQIRKSLVEQIILLQKKATIQTTAYVIEIQYISGRSEEVTIIVRDLEFNAPQSDLKYVEFIPKDLIESTDSIEFITSGVRILENDPVFEIEAKELTKFVYYVNGKLSLDQVPKIKPILITTEFTDNKITGLSILDNLGFSPSNTKIFVIELFIVFILLGVYLFYSKSTVISLPNWKKPKKVSTSPSTTEIAVITDNQKVQYLRTVIKQAQDLLTKNQIKDAALKYHEAKFLYDLLTESDKDHLYNDVFELSDNLTLNHIELLVDEAIVKLANNNNNEAHNLYEEIQLEFDKLSEENQEKVYSRCCELALHLNK